MRNKLNKFIAIVTTAALVLCAGAHECISAVVHKRAGHQVTRSPGHWRLGIEYGVWSIECRDKCGSSVFLRPSSFVSQSSRIPHPTSHVTRVCTITVLRPVGRDEREVAGGVNVEQARLLIGETQDACFLLGTCREHSVDLARRLIESGVEERGMRVAVMSEDDQTVVVVTAGEKRWLLDAYPAGRVGAEHEGLAQRYGDSRFIICEIGQLPADRQPALVSNEIMVRLSDQARLEARNADFYRTEIIRFQRYLDGYLSDDRQERRWVRTDLPTARAAVRRALVCVTERLQRLEIGARYPHRILPTDSQSAAYSVLRPLAAGEPKKRHETLRMIKRNIKRLDRQDRGRQYLNRSRPGPVVAYILGLDRAGREQAAQTLVRFAEDRFFWKPCHRNHDITDDIYMLCRADQTFLDLFARIIAGYAGKSHLSPLRRRVLTEIFGKLFVHWDAHASPVSFSRLLLQYIDRETVVRRLRLGSDTFPHNYSIPVDDAADLMLCRGFSEDNHFVEHIGGGEKTCVGVIQVKAHDRSGVTALSVDIFETGQRYGSRIMRWAARQIGMGKSIVSLYPATPEEISFYRYCVGKGILSKVMIGYDISDSMYEEGAVERIHWQNISDDGLIPSSSSPDQNLFVRGWVRQDIGAIRHTNSILTMSVLRPRAAGERAVISPSLNPEPSPGVVGVYRFQRVYIRRINNRVGEGQELYISMAFMNNAGIIERTSFTISTIDELAVRLQETVRSFEMNIKVEMLEGKSLKTIKLSRQFRYGIGRQPSYATAQFALHRKSRLNIREIRSSLSWIFRPDELTGAADIEGGYCIVPAAVHGGQLIPAAENFIPHSYAADSAVLRPRPYDERQK